ncbi:hypothetical protein ACJBU6_01089 [Exserohilum turcicum]
MHRSIIPITIDKNKQRVKHACNQCRFKKTKCDGERVCSKCRAKDALCDYGNDTAQVRKRDSPGALLEAQNRQLRDAVQTLYEHIQAGHELPILPARSPEDNRPLLHDIIGYINTLRESMTTILEQAQPQVLLPKTTPTVSLSRSQLATPLPLAVAVSVPDLGTFPATSTQHSFLFMAYNASQMNYECLESGVDQQEL